MKTHKWGLVLNVQNQYKYIAQDDEIETNTNVTNDSSTQ